MSPGDEERCLCAVGPRDRRQRFQEVDVQAPAPVPTADLRIGH